MTASPASRAYRPSRDDILIAIAGLAGGLLLWSFGLTSTPLSERGPRWLALVPLGVMCLAALGRRVAPPYALALAVLAQTADILVGSLLATIVLFTDVVYAAVLYGSARLSRALMRGSVVFTVIVSVTLIATFRSPEVLLLAGLCGGVTIAPACTGALLRNHREEAAAERLRAEQTALLAEMDRTQAINAERARMARELHDVVANHLSAIAIHSTAALSLGIGTGAGTGTGTGTATSANASNGTKHAEHAGGAEDGADANAGAQKAAAAAQEALAVIRENSVQGLAEMRRLIGLLRDADRNAQPVATPSLGGIDALLDRARAAADDGHTFTLDDRRTPGERLPAPVELAAYRVVQEAVTNALKHASPGPVTVELERDKALRIRVTSPLAGDDSPRAPGAGAGLVGMRERVDLLHGELSAGPATDHDGAKIWEVRAALPAPTEPGAPETPRTGTARAGTARTGPGRTETARTETARTETARTTGPLDHKEKNR
ncbi:histidine kinase [Streptomyces iconiensis]|uniref:histidine kinase n=2 Tax=Streptomyces iconiensis TaxID=1384038 RepID=A0ABT7A1K5_9ACTN|nr:histidine kinase [Streptomyces iconiensis]